MKIFIASYCSNCFLTCGIQILCNRHRKIKFFYEIMDVIYLLMVIE